ncbi:hypothetical protein D3C87_1961190 [compost metagenome]
MVPPVAPVRRLILEHLAPGGQGVLRDHVAVALGGGEADPHEHALAGLDRAAELGQGGDQLLVVEVGEAALSLGAGVNVRRQEEVGSLHFEPV